MKKTQNLVFRFSLKIMQGKNTEFSVVSIPFLFGCLKHYTRKKGNLVLFYTFSLVQFKELYKEVKKKKKRI